MSDFKQTIKTYLDKRASEDELFAKAYAKENKNIDECCAYIIGEIAKRVQRTGNMAVEPVSREEAFGLAVHYYDEDDIKVNKNAPKAAVSVPKTEKSVLNPDKPKLETVFTVADKPEPKAQRPNKQKPAKKVTPGTQLNLFDF